MGAIETLRPVTLEARHIEGCVALSTEAHWNQVAADWALVIAHGAAIGYEDPGGRLVASALALPYGDEFGWISMVLVTESWRRRGLATRLLKDCMDLLEDRGLAQILDATPAGEGVYRPLGFQDQFVMRRWEADGVRVATPPEIQSRPLLAGEMPAVLAYDREVFAGDRGFILEDLAMRGGGLARMAINGRGFLLSRDGRRARQIGPICADSSATALDMLQCALSGADGPLFIDVPDQHAVVIDFLRDAGFKEQRRFTRMVRGANTEFGDPSRMFAVAGPELG